MTELPRQLQNDSFRFIRLEGKTKDPIKNIPWLQNMIGWREAEKWMNEGNNCGIVGGYGGLRLLDVDKSAVEGGLADKVDALLQTFTVRTGGGGFHFYFISDYKENHPFGEDLGELRAQNQYVVCAGSTHPDTKEKYAVWNDCPIAEVDLGTVKRVLKLFGGRMKPKDEDMVVSPLKKPLKVIPDWIDKLISEGVKKGERNVSAYKIIKELHNRGFSQEEILGQIVIFDSNCKPPKGKDTVVSHANYVLDHADKYLVDTVNKEWLEKQNYGAEAEGVEEVAALPTKEEWKIIDLDTFLSTEYPAPAYQIEPFIPERSITFLAGYQSTFKTTLGVYISLCQAYGVKLFNKFYVKRGNVWYINQELDASLFQDLWNRMMKKMGLEKSKAAKVSNFIEFDIGDKKQQEKILKEVKENDLKLIVLDSFDATFTIKEDSADEMKRLFNDFLKSKLNAEAGCCVLIIDHEGKDVGDGRQRVDRIRGSSTKRNKADSIVMVDRDKKTTRFTLTQEKMRGRPEYEPIHIQWQYGEDTLIPVLMSEEEVEDNIASDCATDLLAVLVKNGSFHSTELKEKWANKYTHRTFYRGLEKLVKDGKAARKKGKKAIYMLPEMAGKEEGG